MQRHQTSFLDIKPHLVGGAELIAVGGLDPLVAMMLQFPHKARPALGMQQIPGIEVDQATGLEHARKLPQIQEQIFFVHMEQHQMGIGPIKAIIAKGQRGTVKLMEVDIR